MDKVLIAVLTLALIIAVPLGGIWALNTLFATAIPFTVKTWAAAAILASCFTGTRGARRDS